MKGIKPSYKQPEKWGKTGKEKAALMTERPRANFLLVL